MRALVVRQPWASLIAEGRKTIEVRSWSTHYRGPLLILSAASPYRGGGWHALPARQPLREAVALVQLVDVRPVAPRDARRACFDDPTGFAWVLDGAEPVTLLEPVPGRLGLIAVDPGLVVTNR